MAKICVFAVRFDKKSPIWGYDRSQGELKNVGHIVEPNAHW